MAGRSSAGEMAHTDAARLHEQWQGGDDLQILDVREPWEHAQGTIQGAILMPMDQVRQRLGELDRTRPVAVICHLGSRSAMVASFLARQGFERVANVDDGMDGWERQGFPTVSQAGNS